MAAADEGRLYPLFLKLDSRTVLVIGAGSVAERKVTSLLQAGAQVRLVAPQATDALQRLARKGAVEWRQRTFQESDLQGVWLAIAATSDPLVQKRAAVAAETHRTFLVAVDDRANASAYAAAIVERPPFTVAISSSGATPALTRLLREIIEQALPGSDWVAHAMELRAKWSAEKTPHADRFAELLRALKDRAADTSSK